MKLHPAIFLCFTLFSFPTCAEDIEGSLQTAFDKRYADYFQAGSQAALPFTRLDKHEWKNLFTSGNFHLIFTEPERFYGGKSYTLKLYRETSKNQYFLDAIGGFWGMEELVFGPIQEQELK